MDVIDPKGVCRTREEKIQNCGLRTSEENFLDIEDTDSGGSEVKSIGQCRNFVE